MRCASPVGLNRWLERLSKVSVENYRGYQIETDSDEDASNPRDDDNLGSLVCWHSRYRLGDDNPRQAADQYLEWLALNKVGRGELLGEEVISDERIQEILAKHFVVLPVYLYDHSGLCMQTSPFSCSWDSGQVGWIHCERTKAQSWFSLDFSQTRIETCLTQEVSSYSTYLSGGYLRYVVRHKRRCVDSCGGFEDEQECLVEAKSVVDRNIIHRIKLQKQKAFNGAHVCI